MFTKNSVTLNSEAVLFPGFLYISSQLISFSFRMLDIFICIYNMKVEINNTIFTCLPPFQKEVDVETYRIFVVDNGSTDGTDGKEIENMGSNIKYLRYPHPTPSPAKALNWAIENWGENENVMVCIDGARMFSPHLISKANFLLNRFPSAFVYTIGYHLGDETHMSLSNKGYTTEQGRKFLLSLDWKNDPGQLQSNSVFAGSSHGGYFEPVSESNAFSTSRLNFERIGGFREEFVSPGGGSSNREIFQRYVLDEHTDNFCLLKEGTYHQYHGGIATSNKVDRKLFRQEYFDIIGSPLVTNDYVRYYF